jgi:hypothetical protein
MLLPRPKPVQTWPTQVWFLTLLASPRWSACHGHSPPTQAILQGLKPSTSHHTYPIASFSPLLSQTCLQTADISLISHLGHATAPTTASTSCPSNAALTGLWLLLLNFHPSPLPLPLPSSLFFIMSCYWGVTSNGLGLGCLSDAVVINKLHKSAAVLLPHFSGSDFCVEYEK